MAEGGGTSPASGRGDLDAAESRSKYPLHWMVWFDEHRQLTSRLKRDRNDLEVRDPRGRTPLMLAVTLGNVRCVRILLEFGASANVENREGFTTTHEAVSTGDPELLALVLHARDLQKYQSSVAAIPDLLKNIRDTPDFYVEMKWEFTSWVPLLSRVCPSDTYRVFKSGSNVRIDTTLLGFEHSSWQRGKRSYIFKGEATQATLYEVNHDSRQVHAEIMHVSAPGDHAQIVNSLRPDPENIAARLCSPIVCTYVDTDKIHFERMRTGMLGWRSDRTENVNGFDAKVFTASNVEFVTKSRVEHLSEEDKKRHKSSQSPLQSLLGTLSEERIVAQASQDEDLVEARGNPCHIRPEEYFDETVPLINRDIGRPRESASRVQRFKATLWLCDTYPLSLAEQVLPIVDLMSLNSSHFAKLRSFITLQLPTGFPVKIEIPLFHVLNARVTFGNINGNDQRVYGVERDREQAKCTIDPSIFEIPRDYVRIGTSRTNATGSSARGGRASFYAEEEDELLQFAIEQSLVDAGSLEDKVTVWEALNSAAPRYETNGNLAPASKDGSSLLLLPPSNGNGPPESALENPSHQNSTSPLNEKQCPTHMERQQNQKQQQANGRLPPQLSNNARATHASDGDIRAHKLQYKSHDKLLFRALQNGIEPSAERAPDEDDNDDELSLALKLSRELREEEERKIAEEEELMARILQLSLTDQ